MFANTKSKASKTKMKSWQVASVSCRWNDSKAEKCCKRLCRNTLNILKCSYVRSIKMSMYLSIHTIILYTSQSIEITMRWANEITFQVNFRGINTVFHCIFVYYTWKKTPNYEYYSVFRFSVCLNGETKNTTHQTRQQQQQQQKNKS